MKLIKDRNAHSHEEFFDTEDQAFACIEGLYLGSHVRRIITDENGKPFPLHFYEGEDAEAFIYGIRLAQIHFGRIVMNTIEFHAIGGYRVLFRVDPEK